MSKNVWNYSYAIVLGFTALVLPLYNNCSNRDIDVQRLDSPSVTSVGNPMRDEKAKGLATKICSKLVTCKPGLYSDYCESQVLQTSGITENLGIPANTFMVFNELIVAEKAHRVVGDEIRVNACAAGIQELDCRDTAIVNAYAPLSSTPFQGVASLVGSQSRNCSTAFACTGSCTAPKPTPTPGQSPTPPPGNIPTPPSQISCWCHDMSSLTPGAQINCPNHPGLIGPPTSNEIVMGDLWNNASCTDRIGSRRMGWGPENMGGLLKDFISLDGTPYPLASGISCVSDGTGRYFSLPPKTQWDEGTCTWLAPDTATCAAAGCLSN